MAGVDIFFVSMVLLLGVFNTDVYSVLGTIMTHLCKLPCATGFEECGIEHCLFVAAQKCCMVSATSIFGCSSFACPLHNVPQAGK